MINLRLAVFNLFPAAPLDGGRVLRAVLGALRGDRWAARLTAARVGRALAAVLVAAGVVLAFTADIGGLWLALLRWFIGAFAGAGNGGPARAAPSTASRCPGPCRRPRP